MSNDIIMSKTAIGLGRRRLPYAEFHKRQPNYRKHRLRPVDASCLQNGIGNYFCNCLGGAVCPIVNVRSHVGGIWNVGKALSASILRFAYQPKFDVF